MVNYDPFIMEDPHFGGIVQKAKAEGLAEGLAEGRAEGEIQALATLKNMVLSSIEERFPALAASVGKAVWPDNIEALGLLAMKLATAPNEEAVRSLLGLSIH